MSEGVADWKSRWPVEQGYQQMKSELGLDHFEGRSWRGFHHHVCLVMVTFGFLALERRRATREGPPVKDDETAGGDVEKKMGDPPVISVPGIRRAMQRLIVPVCRPGSPNYQSCIPSPAVAGEAAPTVHPP